MVVGSHLVQSLVTIVKVVATSEVGAGLAAFSCILVIGLDTTGVMVLITVVGSHFSHSLVTVVSSAASPLDGDGAEVAGTG